MRSTIGAAALAAAVLVPAAGAQASFVGMEGPGIYDLTPQSQVFYVGSGDETNVVRVTNGAGPAIVITDTGAEIQKVPFGDSSDDCVISADEHTATCTPGEAIPPIVDAALGDGNDTLTSEAAIPSAEDLPGNESREPTLRVRGGMGDDTLTGGPTADFLDGGYGNDTLAGGGDADTLADVDDTTFPDGPGDPGDEPLPPGGDDKLAGGPGADSLFGGDGNDDLRGEGADDFLAPGQGTNASDGGEGNDAVAYELARVIDPEGGGYVPVKPEDPGATIRLDAATATAGNGTAGQNDTLANVEDAYGTDGADTLIGSAAGNIIEGSGGNDAIVGNAGPDYLAGQGDKDAINAQDGNTDLVLCGGQSGDAANVDDIDTLRSCPPAGAGTTVTVVPPVAPQVIRTPDDTTKAKLKIKVAKKLKAKKLRKKRVVPCRVTPDEVVRLTCEVQGRAKRLRSIKAVGSVTFGTKTRTAAANTRRTLKPKVAKKFRRLLRKGKRLQVVITAIDGGGNVTRRTRTIRLT